MSHAIVPLAHLRISRVHSSHSWLDKTRSTCKLSDSMAVKKTLIDEHLYMKRLLLYSSFKVLSRWSF